MNKFNLFLLISIGAVVGTASIFGSIMIPALAQGNTTEEVETGPPLILQPQTICQCQRIIRLKKLRLDPH